MTDSAATSGGLFGPRKTETERALCEAFRPVLWSVKDTEETIRQAKEHNAVGVKVCGWKGGK